MRCLYCRKEIGTFKLLRDSEFCSIGHRKSYGERLNKALREMTAPEPAPAGMAGGMVPWPMQEGLCSVTLNRWQFGNGYPTLLQKFAMASAPEADDVAEQDRVPPLCGRWMPGLQAEPVARLIQTSMQPPARLSNAVRVLPFQVPADLTTTPPPLCIRWMPGLRAEPVARFAQTSMQPLAGRSNAVSIPPFRVPADLTTTPPPLCGQWMAEPAPEPVARFVVLQAAPPIEAGFACRAALAQVPGLELAAELPALEKPVDAPAPCQTWMTGLAAEPVAQFVAQSVALSMIAPAAEAALRLPEFALSPALESIEAATEAFVEPALSQIPLSQIPFSQIPLSQIWMRAPEPQPEFGCVRPSVVGEAAPAMPGLAPAILPQHIVGAPHVPAIAGWVAAPTTEPVIARAWPRVAETPLDLLTAAECLVTDLGALAALRQTPAKAQGLAMAASAQSSRPSPVESWLLDAARTVQAIEAQPVSGSPDLAMPDLAMPELAMPDLASVVSGGDPKRGHGYLAVCKPAPELAGPATGAPPMAMESLLVASTAAVMETSAPAARMQSFALAAATESTVPGFEKPFLSPAPATPRLPRNLETPRPISTISVTPPQAENRPPATGMPQPGIIPVEYHAQRQRGTPVCDVQWHTPTIAPAPPRFVVRPVFDRLVDEGLTRPKPTKKQPAFAEVFTMPEARKRNNPAWGYAGRAIAASLVMGTVWFGLSMARLNRQSITARQDVFSGASETAGSGPSLSAAARPAAEVARRTQAQGPVAWVRQTIASRAAYQAADNFHNGMQAWGSAPKSFAAGWEHNRAGYVHPGALAIFNPSRNFKDYHFEFFGQVEQKSMGWVVRAKDTNNYYAMKFKVLEAGLRPVMAVVHYSVVEGRAGHRVETPLNVMMHNNKPFQVAVDVKGNHFSASIDGEQVDSWSDDALPSGGVGFFAEAGERSRVYWMKISKNDDWLGRVCSMLEGSDAGPQVTSELWGGGNRPPGGTPPSQPAGSGDMTLAAAGLGLPFFRAQRTRKSKNGRYQPWSS